MKFIHSNINDGDSLHYLKGRNKMKVTKLVVGILQIVIAVFIAFQS